MPIFLRIIILAISLSLPFTGIAESVGLAVEKGEGYEALSPAQPTEDSEKVEVIEFFWYGCPHCYEFEPHLNEWQKTLPDYVNYIRQPAIFSSSWAPHARAYFTAEALGIVDEVHADLFDVIQNKRQKLANENEIAKFFADHGIDEQAFRKAYTSFIVQMKMRQAEPMSARYGVTGVPAVVINGKYKTNGPLAKNYPNMISVMNYLIEKEKPKIDPVSQNSSQ